jgi:hypothetical protein
LNRAPIVVACDPVIWRPNIVSPGDRLAKRRRLRAWIEHAAFGEPSRSFGNASYFDTASPADREGLGVESPRCHHQVLAGSTRSPA